MKRLVAALSSLEEKPDAIFIAHPPDVRYLTGFTGSNAALVVLRGSPAKSRSTPKAVLFTDGRYTEQARQQVKNARVVIPQESIVKTACEWMQAQRVRRCAFDAEHTSVAALDTMRQYVLGSQRRNFFLSVPPLSARLREVKVSSEIGRLRDAARLGCTLFNGLLSSIRSGMKETDLAAQVEFAARRGGAEGMSFETIVASGPRSALPHGLATARPLPKRGFVVLDFGVMLMGYCSDITRTMHLGSATVAERNVYDAVLEAQMAAIETIRPGVTCGDVDEAARGALRRAKLADFFTHSTGHGVGLEIHEGPRIAARQTDVLKPGMVITIEPGVYLPGRFGVRIEDMVLVTRNGSEVLTSAAPKAWIEL